MRATVVLPTTKNTLLSISYELYRINWCKSRSYDISDMDEEIGINGECYVCLAEFEMNEFQLLFQSVF